MMEDEDKSSSGSIQQNNVSQGNACKDHQSSSTNKEGFKKTSESVMDYAKDTMNSFLKMYGYDDHVTTETILRSSIKSEPTTPTDDQPERSSVLSDGPSETEGDGVISKGDERDRYSMNNSPAPRTATVMPLQSLDSTNLPSKSSSSSFENSSKAPGTPRRPLTPYMRYRNMIFEEIKHKYPGCSPYDLACLISSKWSKLTDSERKVWEDQYEEDMKEYNEAMQIHYNLPSSKRDWMQEKKTPAHLLSFVENINLRIEPQSPAQGKATQESGKSNSMGQSGYCHWCKIRSYLQDFSTVKDGREIYCTGLCSEKCFNEAVKQICSVEGGSSKPRYVRSTRPTLAYHDDVRYSPASDSTVASVATSSLTFNWDHYLTETQATAAPWIYFKQSRNPPQNNFVVGMKLEASVNEQYGSKLYSLATVVAIQGSRMLLHFDGADTSSDVWKMPDSGDIHPVGWTDGSKLRPPVGFKFDTAHYSNFFASSLHTADIAPARLFKKEPTIPMENYFSPGMKLEAVNRQKPSVIGVATVVNVDGEQLRIEFDGYKGVGFWCHYASRDLFPAGWCGRADHHLQPPPETKNDETSTSLPRSQGRSTSPPHVSSENTNQTSAPLRNSISLPAQRESVSSTSTWKDKLSLPNNVEVFVNGDCFCGPYIEAQKFERLPRVYRGSIVSVLKNILEDTIKCATDPKTVFGFLKPGRGNCVITALCDGVTYQCCLNSVDRVSKFWTVLEQFSDNLRCCSNLFSSTDLRSCRRCSNNRSSHSIIQQAKRTNSQSYSQPAASISRTRTSSSGPTNLDYYKNIYRRDKTYETSSYSMVSYLAPRSESSISRSDSVFEHSREDNGGKGRGEGNLSDSRYEPEITVDVDGFEEPASKKKKTEKKIAGGIEVTTAPKLWSIDDVTAFVVQTDLKDYIEKFKENEIDGKALLLLQRDLVLSHMGFKLGPAVKLLDLIEELKLVQEKFT